MTRFEWKMQKIVRKCPIRLEVFIMPLSLVLCAVLLYFFVPIYYNKEIKPKVVKFVCEYKANKKRKLEEIEYKNRLEEEKNEHERIKIVEESKKQEEIVKEKLELEIRCNNNFKAGDRIKIYDMNTLVPINDYDRDGNQKYRFSIIDIDTVKRVEGTTIYCENNILIYPNNNFDKVQSKREWADLVKMRLDGKLSIIKEEK